MRGVGKVMERDMAMNLDPNEDLPIRDQNWIFAIEESSTHLTFHPNYKLSSYIQK